MMIRTTLPILSTILSAVLISPNLAIAQKDSDYLKTTVTYRTVEKLPIRANVYRPNDSVKRPVVVWIHGGALINGHRDGISGRVRDYAMDRGFALVSIDYRLAPETKVPGIIEDVEQAFVWIRGNGARQFHFDTSRIAVTGGSAGGYLTMSTGYRVKPRPKALVAFWGYGDLVGDWYSTPSPHPRHNKIKVSREEALRQVSGPPVSDSRDRKGNGGLFYVYTRQTGLWPKEVTGGWDPHTETQKFAPYMPVRNVTPEYPPTFMIHGTADTDVPFEQSQMMAAEFQRHGVPHKLAAIKGGEHGLGGGDKDKIEQAYNGAWEFLDKYLIAR